MKKGLFLYTSNEGQTQKIVDFIENQLETQIEITAFQLTKENENALLWTDFSFVLIASSIRYGSYPAFLRKWIEQHRAFLDKTSTAFVGVNLVARKENRNTPETNGYTKKFLTTLNWQPNFCAVFAGALQYPKYNVLDKAMIRFIMWLGKGETDVTKAFVEYTDWDKVAIFAQELKQQWR